MGGAQPDGPFNRRDRELLTLAGFGMSPASIAVLMGGDWTARGVALRVRRLQAVRDERCMTRRRLVDVLKPGRRLEALASAKQASRIARAYPPPARPAPVVIKHQGRT